MELTHNNTESKYEVYVTVDDGIVIKSVHNKDMVITLVVIFYTIDGDQWVVWSVTAHGHRMKGDGTPGQRPDSREYTLTTGFPDWAAKAAEHYRPKAASPLPPVPTCVLDVEG